MCTKRKTKEDIISHCKKSSLVILTDLINVKGNDVVDVLCRCGKQFNTKLKYLTHSRVMSCGCSRKESQIHRRIDLVGQKFDMLVVIELDHRNSKESWWKCKCDCGNVVIKHGTQLCPSSGKNYRQSCGCVRALSVKQSRWTGYEDISGKYLNNLQTGARNRSLVYEITNEYLWQQYISQGRSCVLSGVPIGFFDKTASLDRIDSIRGYVEGNVQWVHKTVNNMKWNFEEHEFLHLCNLVVAPTIHEQSNESCVELPHHHNWKGVGNIPLDFFTRYKKAAAKRNLVFEILIEELWDLFIKQRGLCAVTGLPLCVGTALVDVTASIDRIDNSVGYISGNIQWVHKNFNWKLRKNMSMTDVTTWCKKIVRHTNENSKN